MAADLPPPSKCRFCPAQIRWALFVQHYKKLPLEVKPSAQGEWVLVQDQVLGLLAVPFDASKHTTQFRFRSHFERCRPSPERAAATRKPDSTAGLRFPKRKAELKFPPLEQLLREAALPHTGCIRRGGACSCGPVTLTQEQRRWAEGEVRRGQ